MTSFPCIHSPTFMYNTPKPQPPVHNQAPQSFPWFPQLFHIHWLSPQKAQCPLHTTSLHFTLSHAHLTSSCPSGYHITPVHSITCTPCTLLSHTHVYLYIHLLYITIWFLFKASIYNYHQLKKIYLLILSYNDKCLYLDIYICRLLSSINYKKFEVKERSIQWTNFKWRTFLQIHSLGTTVDKCFYHKQDCPVCNNRTDKNKYHISQHV